MAELSVVDAAKDADPTLAIATRFAWGMLDSVFILGKHACTRVAAMNEFVLEDYHDSWGERMDEGPLNLSGKRILFLGPAETEGARRVDTLAYDVVVITNNMVQIFDRPHHTLVVVANDFFSNNHADRIVARCPDAVLCTTLGGLNAMRALHYERRPKARRMPRPAVARGQPLGLSFFLEYAIQHPFASLHVTGVTFYAGGSQSYVSGYGLLPMGEHDIEANKDYVRDLLRQHENITIDYPIDDTTDPQAAKDAAELATVVTQPQYELDGLGEWVSADGREAAPKPFSSTSSTSAPVDAASPGSDGAGVPGGERRLDTAGL